MLARKEGFALATAALLFMVGGTAVAQTNSPNAQAGNAEAKVSVNNQGAHDVVIAAGQDDGRQVELGLVRGQSGKTFTLPSWLQDGTTEFRIRMTCMLPTPPGSSIEQYHESVKTRLMTSKPGSEIVVTVADPLAESMVAQSG